MNMKLLNHLKYSNNIFILKILEFKVNLNIYKTIIIKIFYIFFSEFVNSIKI
jgi:hypothetical protein